MLELKKIAVTGGIASGKSTVCQIFQELGAFCLNSDKVVHNLLLNPKSPLKDKIIALLGPQIVENQQINREEIASIVFNDFEKLKKFEQLIHPVVIDEINKEYEKQVKQKDLPALFVAEIPLLFEIHAEDYFDYSIAVTAKDELCKQRFDTMNQKKALFDKRRERQLPQQLKKEKADFIIENNGSLVDLRSKVQTLFQQLTNPS